MDCESLFLFLSRWNDLQSVSLPLPNKWRWKFKTLKNIQKRRDQILRLKNMINSNGIIRNVTLFCLVLQNAIYVKNNLVGCLFLWHNNPCRLFIAKFCLPPPYIYIYIYIYIGIYFVLSTLVIVALRHFTVDFSFSFDQLIAYLLIFSTGVMKLAFSFFRPVIFFLFLRGGDSRYCYF